MVGYKKDDLTPHKKLIAGCASGVFTRFVSQPLDIIKLRTQLQKCNPKKPHKLHWLRTTLNIFKEEGINGFFAGHSLGQVHSVLAVSSQFYVFELATSHAASYQLSKAYQPYVRFICGVVAGCCSTTLVMPIEVIRVRQMLVHDQYRGLLNGAAMVYRSGGVRAFYEGLSAALMQMGPQVGISFFAFSSLQPALLKLLHAQQCEGASCASSGANKYRPQHVLAASALAGAAAGFAAKTATYPFDLIKRRLQISSHHVSQDFQTPTTSRRLFRCKNLTQCMFKTVQEEGVGGLFRGWSITIIKAQVTSVLAYTTYEMMCYFLREIEL